MRNLKLRLILSIIMFIVISSTNADTLANQKKSLITQQKFVKKTTPIVFNESAAYKLLYENTKENNERIVSTVQWTIGLSVGFLLAILGGQIFFNWRINKKEIDYIKKDIEEKIGELKAELVKDLADKNKEEVTKILTSFEKLEKDLLSKLKDEFDKNKKFSEINDKMRDFEVESIKREAKNDTKNLKSNIEKIEGDIWKIKGVEANALSSYLRTALLQIELKREVKYILDDIISILTNLDEIHESDSKKLDKLLSELSNSHNTQKDKIIVLYKNKPVYQFANMPRPYGLNVMYGGGMKYVKNAPK